MEFNSGFKGLIYTEPQYIKIVLVSNKLDMTINFHITYLLTFE